MEIHIVGAGPAGLTLAALLPPHWRVHLHEAAWEETGLPTALGMWPAAMRVLDALDLGGELRRSGTHIDTGRIRDRAGRVLVEPRGQDIWLVPRTMLIEALRERLPRHVTVHRERVEAPGSLPGDLVVAADGVHSGVRRALWRDRPRSLRATAVRGVVDSVPQPTALEEWWGRGVMAGATPNAAGTTNWFVTLPRRRFSEIETALAVARERFSGFPAPLREVLAAAEPDRTAVNDLWVSRRPDALVRGRYVLLGDAAHAMAPNLGRGACESLIDAHVLGRALADRPVAAALRHYARRRTLPAQLTRTASGAVLALAAGERGAGVRDAMLRRIPGL